jgi:hypothetical protein
MPFHASFECLWCGIRHAVRGPDDVEGWAQLCPACVGRAGENGFLRFRLRAALEERGRARLPGESTAALDEHVDDDWYLRRGPHSLGSIEDALWAADLDEVTLWLDALPWQGELVELASGSGWWSPLLATHGELWCYDRSTDALDRARARLLAHGLRAHLHVREPLAAPDRLVDGLFIGPRVGPLTRTRRGPLDELARAWLRPGGLLAVVRPTEGGGPDIADLAGRFEAAGFLDVNGTTGRYFDRLSARG